MNRQGLDCGLEIEDAATPDGAEVFGTSEVEKNVSRP